MPARRAHPRQCYRVSALVVPPSWSLAGWLQSLRPEELVIKAIRKRFDEMIRSKHGASLSDAAVHKFERAYVEHIGEAGSHQTVEMMLKESTIIFELAAMVRTPRAHTQCLPPAHSPPYRPRSCRTSPRRPGSARGVKAPPRARAPPR